MNISRRNSAAREAMKIALPIVILLAGGAGAMLILALKKDPASTDVKTVEATVTTVVIEPHHQGVDIQVDGTVVPFREVALSAEVAGRVKTVSERCRAGNYVRQGELLVEIDPADYELEVERLNREWEQSKAMLEESAVELSSTRQLLPLVQEEADLQQKQVDRLRKLGSGVSTETAIDQARRSSLVAQNAMIKLEQQVMMFEKRQLRLEHARDLVEAQLERAKLDLARCRITAPVNGMVVSESVEQDSFVQKGTSLLTVEDTSAIEVKCNLMMDDLDWLWRHQQAQQRRGDEFSSGGFGPDTPRQPVRSGMRDTGGFQSSVPSGSDGGSFDPASGAPREIPAGFDQGGMDQMHPMYSPNDYQLPRAEVTVLWELGGRQYAWRGRLDRYDGIGVNEQTRTVPCRVVVDKPRQVLQPRGGDSKDWVPAQGGPPALVRGMYVELQIHCRPDTPLLSLPERAIRPGNMVWLLRDGKLLFEKVQVATIDDDVAVLDAAGGSIAPGDKVVVSALAHAHSGMEVKEETVQPAKAAEAATTADRSGSKL